jgi:hypothetical protein
MAANLVRIWPCPVTKTGKKSKARDAHAKCAKLFSEQNRFELIHTADNGDCFFNTLTKFAIINNYKPLLLLNNNNYSNNNIRNNTSGHQNDELLRNKLVDHIEENLQNYIAFINNTNNSIESQLHSLRQSGVWDANIGDLVPPAGANAFQININLYNIEENAQGRDVIKLEQYFSEIPSDVFVNIIRINEGHFELLIPRSNHINGLEEKNESKCIEEARSAALIATEAAQIAVQTAKKLSNTQHTNESLKMNERKLNNVVSKLENLSLKQESAPKRRSSRLASKVKNTTVSVSKMNRNKLNNQNKLNKSYQEEINENMKAALEASLLNNAVQSTIPKKKSVIRKKTSTRKKKINRVNNNNMNNNMRAALEASKLNY